MALNRPPLNIPAANIEARYHKLNRIGASDHGFERPAYSDAETEAMQYIERAALAAGLTSRRDDADNLVIETPGDFDQWVETGSHMDTVPGGGNYDGAAGVVAGLEALLAIQAERSDLPFGLRLRLWRGEESAAFGEASIGAQAAFGLLNPAILEKSHQGRTLAGAIISQGANPDCIRGSRPTIPAKERDGILAHIELHIEQGKLLESSKKDIGIVTGIRGSLRRWVRLLGQFDHSGATPMGTENRSDVNLAMAHMLVRLDELAGRRIAEGRDIVQTTGVINTDAGMNSAMPAINENAVSKVSGSGYFSHEIRSCSIEDARAFTGEADEIIMRTAAEFVVKAEIEEFASSAGIPALDADIQKLLAEACRSQGASFMHLPSGAWHDAAVLCGQKKSDASPIPVGMLFIPCRAGVSHSPLEYSSPAQIALGASALAQALLLAGAKGTL